MFKPILRSLGLPALLAVVITGAASSAGADSPIGVWIDDSGQGAIEIKDCNGSLCGQLVWLKSSKYASRCKLSVIGDLSAIGDGKWGGGWIYDPASKAKFDVEITPVSTEKLKVLGYAGTKTFSRTMTWTKAPDGLKRCDDAPPVLEAARAETKKTAAASPGAGARPVGTAPEIVPPVASAAESSASQDEAARALGPDQPTAPAKATSKAASRSTGSQRAAASDRSDKRQPGTVKLAELGKYGLQDITMRKSNGACSLRVSDFARVAFPC